RVEQGELALAEQRRGVEALGVQAAGDVPPVRLGRHQDDRLAAHQALGGEMADGLAVEVVVLVELDDVAVLAGVGEELSPGCRGAGLHLPTVHPRRARGCRETEDSERYLGLTSSVAERPAGVSRVTRPSN